MDGINVGVGEENIGGDGMTCNYHPFRNNPGGICAFCLQEKLGKLVSSSFPLHLHGSSSPSSSSPSFRSDIGHAGAETSSTSSLATAPSVQPILAKPRIDCHYNEYHTSKVRIPFLLAKKDRKKKIMVTSSSNSSDLDSSDVVFKRSKSSSMSRRGHFLNGEEICQRMKAGFWSFLHLPSNSQISKKVDKSSRDSTDNAALAISTTAATESSMVKPKENNTVISSSSLSKKEVTIMEDEDSPGSQTVASSHEHKVSRSRSVGCGSRSFSAEFFGFGDCTLRRVESHREGKPKVSTTIMHRGRRDQHCMKERVKCGGIFAGFIMTSSISYLVSEGGRTRSWGKAFPSPTRASSKPSKDGKHNVVIIREGNSNENTTPDLAAIPSLLAARG